MKQQGDALNQSVCVCVCVCVGALKGNSFTCGHFYSKMRKKVRQVLNRKKKKKESNEFKNNYCYTVCVSPEKKKPIFLL